MRKFPLFLLCLALPQIALAERILPPEAVRGELSGMEYPLARIGGATLRFAPGGKIFDRDNRIIQPVALSIPAAVAYLTDMNGDLAKVWLLTPQEQARLNAPQ